jgi:hypothetical protein
MDREKPACKGLAKRVYGDLMIRNGSGAEFVSNRWVL